MYQARHRGVSTGHRLKSALTVAAVTAGTLVAPLAMSSPTTANADTASIDHERPEWLQRPTTVVNPPAPALGDAIAPAVAQSYVITGDSLGRYDVTATALGQQEIAAFAARIGIEHGLTVDPTKYRAYAMPRITAAPTVTTNANLAEFAQAVTLAASDAANVPPVDLDTQLAKVLALRDATTVNIDQLAGNARVALVAMEPSVRAAQSRAVAAIADLTTRPLPDPSPIVDQAREDLQGYGGGRDFTAEGIQQAIDSFDALGRLQALLADGDPAQHIAQINALLTEVIATVDPQPLLVALGELVSSINVDALLASVGLPTTEEIVEDPVHASPVGTDAVSDAYGGVLGDVLVLPHGAVVEEVGAAYEDGAYKIETVLETTPLAGAGTTLGGIAFVPQGDDWDPAGGLGCLGRKQNNTAWYDPCSFWYHLARDGNGYRQTWGLKQYGTAKSKSTWRLHHFEVKSWRTKGSPDQDWLDWNPRSDDDRGHCTTQTVGVNVKAAYLEHSSQHCDVWDIHKGSEPADFSNTWRGWTHRSEREVASIIATNTPNGQNPNDHVRFDYYAY